MADCRQLSLGMVVYNLFNLVFLEETMNFEEGQVFVMIDKKDNAECTQI